MKISRNELRRMILESLLHREKTLNEVSLGKMRKTIIDAQEEDVRKGEGDVTIRDNNDVKDVIKKLQDFKQDSSGPFNPRNKAREQEAEELLRFAKEAQAGKNPEPPVVSKTDQNQEEQNDASSNEDWTKYGDEPEWEYQIQGSAGKQIWVARKAGVSNAQVFQLNNPKYAETVKRLDSDNKMPKRDQASKDADPALKPAAKPAANKETPSENQSSAQDTAPETPTNAENKSLPTYIFKGSDADWRRGTLNTYPRMPLPNIVATGDFFNLDNNESTRNVALQNIINWLYNSDVVTGPGGDFSGMPKDARYDLRKALGVTGNNWGEKSEVAYKDHIIGMQSGIESEPVKRIIKATIEAFARINNAYNHSLNMKAKTDNAANESKVTYGKSHATLIRERYWGRY